MDVDPGLCGACEHGRTVQTSRSVFWLCQRSFTDAAFPKYPRLPVRACAGYEQKPDARVVPRGDER